MSTAPQDIDLSALPADVAAAFKALATRAAELEALTKRQDALIQELHHAFDGKKSEKLTEERAIVRH